MGKIWEILKKKKLKTFYIWTNNQIHHSLTDLNCDTKNRGSNNNDYLKKLSCEMLKILWVLCVIDIINNH